MTVSILISNPILMQSTKAQVFCRHSIITVRHEWASRLNLIMIRSQKRRSIIMQTKERTLYFITKLACLKPSSWRPEHAATV